MAHAEVVSANQIEGAWAGNRDFPGRNWATYFMCKIAMVVGVEEVMAAQERRTEQLMLNPEVVGTATGLAEDGTPYISVFTKSGIIGEIPRSIEGIPVKVEVTGEIYALQDQGTSAMPISVASMGDLDPTAKWPRPVPIGVSTGVGIPGNGVMATAGTIGARVRKDDGLIFALSNNHVWYFGSLTPEGTAPVIQPGGKDNGLLGDKIGTLSEIAPLIIDGETANYMDAAIALVSRSTVGASTPPDGYGFIKSTVFDARLWAIRGYEILVQKYSKTTGLTKGKITSFNAIFGD